MRIAARNIAPRGSGVRHEKRIAHECGIADQVGEAVGSVAGRTVRARFIAGSTGAISCGSVCLAFPGSFRYFDTTIIAAARTPAASAYKLYFRCSCSAWGSRWVAPTYTSAPADSDNRAPSTG